MRTKRQTVTFTQTFTLPGLDGQQPPGSYLVVIEEEQIPALLFEGWRRVFTQFRTPSLEKDTGFEQYSAINPAELESALTADKQKIGC
ncbi:MAG: hypothetical protein ACKVP5_18950 [Aestuariivirga sp.]